MLTPRAEKELGKLGAVDQARVRKFLRTNIEGTDDPRRLGKPLEGAKSEYWRYRVGDIRILCRLEYERVVVVVVTIANRCDVYR
jgi:mRNA interferase RelE/StbE